jgi:oligoendopeptidase F
MKLIINVANERYANVEVSGFKFEVELENVPEDRQWKIEELRGERDRLQVDFNNVADQLSQALATIRTQRTEAAPVRNKINAIKKVRELTNMGLKEAVDLTDAMVVALNQ